MKNVIAYYYNLYSYDIHQNDENYKFSVGNYHYVLTPCNINTISEIYELSNMLIANGVYVHQIMPNTSNNLYTIVNGKSYALLRLYSLMDEKVEFQDILKFSNTASKIQINDYESPNWALLWANKIDYFEYQISQFGKKFPIIRESISYYIGMVETGISLYRNSNIGIIKDNVNLNVTHKRLKTDDTLYDLYNPMNLLIDYNIRDAVEYFKNLFLIKENILNDVIKYFQYQYLTSYDCFLFFVRMFYPSFYFDLYEQIVENNDNEEKLLVIIEKSSSYEKLIKDIYIYLSNYINMPDIEWLKKI